MTPSRREFLAACAGAIPALAGESSRGGEGNADDQPSLGVVILTYSGRVAADRARGGSNRLDDPLNFLEYCHAMGVRGVQVAIGARDSAYSERLAKRAAAYGMYLEGIVRLPRNRTDMERFRDEVGTAFLAGARVLQTTLMDGHRFETFTTAAAFRRFADAAFESLTLAKEVLAMFGMKLAIENHKNLRAGELIDVVKRVESEHIGVCLDTGNSIALLEDPMEVVEALAPWALTTHIKDMAVREYERGFLLAEVTLGTGFLELTRMIQVLRAARPEIRLNLEMMTRDPLEVPCLTEKYWATFEDLPGIHLARTLTTVREHASKHPLPRVGSLALDERLKVEEDNARLCLASARAMLAPEVAGR
jgi:3-oxoisoapionate decarboxylase